MKPLFTFQQFSIRQDKCAMKVGTDGVLLGAWAEARQGNILDIGTGTALIALMLAQRSPKAQITAIDIDKGAIQQAQENVLQSPWADRIQVLQQDILQYQPPHKFQEIVSNPPFFLHSLTGATQQRNVARIATQQLFEGIAHFVEKHLEEDGVFEVILPTPIAEDFIFMLWAGHNLHLKRQTQIITKQGKPCKRTLLSFSKRPMPPIKTTLCLMDEEGKRTQEYQNMTKGFYL